MLLVQLVPGLSVAPPLFQCKMCVITGCHPTFQNSQDAKRFGPFSWFYKLEDGDMLKGLNLEP